MADHGIVTNPIVFTNQIEAETPKTDIPEIYAPLLRTYLYYVWRGAFEARRKYLWKKVNGDLALLCLAIYKSFIPVIELIRLGHPGDTLNLIRAIIERIALLGYLNNNDTQLDKYNCGKSLYKEANKWAKDEWEKNETTKKLFFLYGQLSKHVHPTNEGIAGYVAGDNNEIGRAFRQYMKPESERPLDMSYHYDAGLISLLFALRIADLTTMDLFNDSKFKPILEDTSCLVYLSREDFENTVKILQSWVDDGTQLLNNSHMK